MPPITGARTLWSFPFSAGLSAEEKAEMGDSPDFRGIVERVRRSDQAGLSLAPYGLDVQHLHFQAHYAQGEWDHAQEMANAWPVRVSKVVQVCPSVEPDSVQSRGSRSGASLAEVSE